MSIRQLRELSAQRSLGCTHSSGRRVSGNDGDDSRPVSPDKQVSSEFHQDPVRQEFYGRRHRSVNSRPVTGLAIPGQQRQYTNLQDDFCYLSICVQLKVPARSGTKAGGAAFSTAVKQRQQQHSTTRLPQQPQKPAQHKQQSTSRPRTAQSVHTVSAAIHLSTLYNTMSPCTCLTAIGPYPDRLGNHLHMDLSVVLRFGRSPGSVAAVCMVHCLHL